MAARYRTALTLPYASTRLEGPLILLPTVQAGGCETGRLAAACNPTLAHAAIHATARA